MVTQEDILAMAEDNVVLLDFWAPWCGPCRALAPHLDDIQKTYEDRLKVIKINADEAAALAHAYGVRALPTLFLLKGESILDQRQGGMTPSSLQSWVNSFLTN